MAVAVGITLLVVVNRGGETVPLPTGSSGVPEPASGATAETPPVADAGAPGTAAIPELTPTPEPAVKEEPKKEEPKIASRDVQYGYYVDNGDGTVTDTNTGLMWTRTDSRKETGRGELGRGEGVGGRPHHRRL